MPPQRSRAHATKKAGLSADQRAEIDAALSAYGGRLTDDDRIAKNDKVTSVHLEAKGGRLKMIGGGNVLASYPAGRAGQGVSDFVEKFWFWKKEASTGHARKKSPMQLDREIAEALATPDKRSRTSHARRGASVNEAERIAEQRDVEIAPSLGRTRAEIVRRINAIVRAADGRNVYLNRERLGDAKVHRITRARTKGRGMEALVLSTGQWLPVSPELGDRIDVR